MSLDETTVRPARIDAHHHFWDPALFDYPWMAGAALDPVRRSFGPLDLLPELQASSIEGTVLVQTVSDISETRMFLDTAQATPFVRGVVGWVDLTSPSVGEVLDELLETYGDLLVGVRHQVHDEVDPEWLGRDDVRRGLQRVAVRNLAYDLLVRTRELPAAVAAVRDLPSLSFVLDHIAKPRIAAGWDEEWARALSALAKEPNTSVKLSGMVTEAEWTSWGVETLRPFVDRTLELFGAERSLFGSDWPVCLLAADSYGEVVNTLEALVSGLSTDEQAQVFGGNAERVYGLGRN